MKTLKRLAILILVLITTTPQIFQVYRVIYHNLIAKDEKIMDMVKGMINADKVIKTNYIDEEKEYTEAIKRRFKRQKANLERLNKCQV